MTEITKKEFKSLHSNKEIGLIQSVFNKDKETCKTILTEYLSRCSENEINLIKLSRYSIANDGDISKTKIFTDGPFIYVETVTDASKDDTCSWNDIRTDTVIYKLVA